MKGLGGGKEWNRRIKQTGKQKKRAREGIQRETAKTKNHLRGHMET